MRSFPHRAAGLRLAGFAALAAACVLATTPASAGRPVKVKLATIAPSGSPWHNLLMEMGERWKEVSDGKVQLQIYGGGTAGAEGDVLRKMRIGHLHAATLTAVGLRDISDREVQTLQVPGLIKSPAELEHVWKVMGPEFEKTLEGKGFKVLNWGEAGWGRFFSKEPLKNPSQAGDFKVFTVVGDPEVARIWQNLGFNPVVIASTEMVPALKTGMINLTFAPPIGALSLQWFHEVPHMSDFTWGPLVGGTVMTTKIWKRIPEDLQPEILAIANDIGQRTTELIREKDVEAIEAMKAKGLTIVETSDEDRAAWQAAAEKTWTEARGTAVPAATFDAIRKHLEEFRANPAAAETAQAEPPAPAGE